MLLNLLVFEGLTGERNKPNVEATLEDLDSSKVVGPRPLLGVIATLAVNNHQDVEVVKLCWLHHLGSFDDCCARSSLSF